MNYLPHFDSCYENCTSPFTDLLLPDEMTYNDVLNRLQKLDQNKSCRPDNLHPALLKNSSDAFALPLTLVFL